VSYIVTFITTPRMAAADVVVADADTNAITDDTLLHKLFPLLGQQRKLKDGTVATEFVINACPGKYAYREPWISFVSSSDDNLKGRIITGDGSDHVSNRHEGQYELIPNAENGGVLKLTDLIVTIYGMGYDNEETSSCKDFETTYTFDPTVCYDGETNGEEHDMSLYTYFEAHCAVKFADHPAYPSLKGTEYGPYGIEKPLYSVKRIQTIGEFVAEGIDVTPNGYIAYVPREFWTRHNGFEGFFDGIMDQACEFVTKNGGDKKVIEMMRSDGIEHLLIIYTHKLEICCVILDRRIHWKENQTNYNIRFITHVFIDPEHHDIDVISLLGLNRFMHWFKYLIVPTDMIVCDAFKSDYELMAVKTVHEIEFTKEKQDQIKGEAGNIYKSGQYKHFEIVTMH
jgi:hypothetical protein